MDCLFNLLIVSFDAQKNVKFLSSPACLFLLFVAFTFDVISKKPLPNSGLWSFYPVFSFKFLQFKLLNLGLLSIWVNFCVVLRRVQLHSFYSFHSRGRDWLYPFEGFLALLLKTIWQSVQLLSRIQLLVTPWTVALQASLSVTSSRSLLKLMSIKSVMPSNHLVLCRPLLLPSIFPSIRIFSSESVIPIRWPKYWSFSFSISPSNEYSGFISFRIDWLDLLVVQRALKRLLQHQSSKASSALTFNNNCGGLYLGSLFYAIVYANTTLDLCSFAKSFKSGSCYYFSFMLLLLQLRPSFSRLHSGDDIQAIHGLLRSCMYFRMGFLFLKKMSLGFWWGLHWICRLLWSVSVS